MSQDVNPKRKTSRDIQATERRQQILDVAKRLFAEQGYHATSMREINKGIGMGEALTYHHFPGGKLEILKSVLQDAQEKRMKDLTDFSKSFSYDLSLKEFLQTFAHIITERLMIDKEYLQILLREKNLLDKEELTILTELALKPFYAIADYLVYHAKLGQIRDMDFHLAANQFIAQIAVNIFRRVFFEEGMDSQGLEQLIDFYVKLWSK